MNETYSHGKLLLSGEYVVLHGASALAIPLQTGQHFQVTESADDGLVWQSYYQDQLWFEARFSSGLLVLSTTHSERASIIALILNKARKMADKPKDFFNHKFVVTRLDFHPDWGLGSSSTLIVNLSRWMGIDPFQLSAITLGGSNYDIACSLSRHPILYCREGHDHHVRAVDFDPSFASQLWFVFLGQKTNSRMSVSQLVGDRFPDQALVERVTRLSMAMVECTDFSFFMDLMAEHERLIGNYIGIEPVKSRQFSDFDGAVKSLGAWGGDFVMVASDKDALQVSDYFKYKGLDVMFNYNDLTLKPEFIDHGNN